MGGHLPPDGKLGQAAIAADHTGAENSLADLLQALEDVRNLPHSVTVLHKVLARQQDRQTVQGVIEAGQVLWADDIACLIVERKIDAGLVPALLPEARVVIVASPPTSWLIWSMPTPSVTTGWAACSLGVEVRRGATSVSFHIPEQGTINQRVWAWVDGFGKTGGRQRSAAIREAIYQYHLAEREEPPAELAQLLSQQTALLTRLARQIE